MRSLLGFADEEQEDAGRPLDLQTVAERHIARVLKLTSGNKSEAARILGVDRRTLLRKGFEVL